jgi:hypothetical protein
MIGKSDGSISSNGTSTDPLRGRRFVRVSELVWQNRAIVRVIRRFPITRLQNMMLEELERRNYAETTIECYISAIEELAQYFNRRPDQLGPAHIFAPNARPIASQGFAAAGLLQKMAAVIHGKVQVSE